MNSYFRLSGHDNDTYAFHGRTDVRRCTQCGNLTHKWEESLHGLRIHKRRTADISTTYDGVLVVSKRFVLVCEHNLMNNVMFSRLPDDPDFFMIGSNCEVRFDVKRRGTRFENFCGLCRQWDAVAGADPILLLPGQIIADNGFARTDVEFGGGDEKHPILLCGSSAGKILQQSQLKDLEIQTIPNK
jgi:hypothetical protein